MEKYESCTAPESGGHNPRKARLMKALYTYTRIAGKFLYFLLWVGISRPVRQSGYVLHKQARIHYQLYGQGEPIVLLHGGLSNRLSWFAQIPFLCGCGRQVLVIDTRGHGKSSFGDDALSYQLFAEDVLAVLDHVRIEQSDIVGWSDGGISALVLGQFASHRVKRIVAISANFNPQGLTQKAQQLLYKTPNAIQFWVQSLWTGSGAYFERLRRHIQHIWASPILLKSDLSNMRVPALIVVGEHDDITVAHSVEMANLIACARLVVIRNGGHATPVTHANQINALIRDFCKCDNMKLKTLEGTTS